MPSFRIRILKNKEPILNRVFNDFSRKELAENWAANMKDAHKADSFTVVQVSSSTTKFKKSKS